MREISIYDGKYTFIMNDDGTINEILRHGETWPASYHYIHKEIILALVQEIIDLRNQQNRTIYEIDPETNSIEKLVPPLKPDELGD